MEANLNVDINLHGTITVDGTLNGTISGGGGGAKLQSKSVSPARTAQTVLPDEGFDGLSDVEISAASIKPITISAGMAGDEGLMPGPDYVGFGPINVKPLQNKTVTPTAQQQTITADNNNDYLGLGVVTVEAASGGTDALNVLFNSPNAQPVFTMIDENQEHSCYGFNGKLNIVLPQTITNIYPNAFYRTRNIKSISGAGVVTIGDDAFSACRNLSSVDFPALSSIGTSAFRENDVLTTLRLGNVSSIPEEALAHMISLHDVYLGFDGVVSIDFSTIDNPFADSGTETEQINVHVPSAHLSAYQSDADWSAVVQDCLDNYGVTMTLVGDYA